MIDKKVIKKMVDHILHPQKRQFLDNQIMHVEREWFFGVLFSALVLAGGAILSVQLYEQYNDVTVSETDLDQTAIVYKDNLVKKVLQDFSKREAVYEDLKAKVNTPGLSPVATTTSTAVMDNETQIPDTTSGLTDNIEGVNTGTGNQSEEANTENEGESGEDIE